MDFIFGVNDVLGVNTFAGFGVAVGVVDTAVHDNMLKASADDVELSSVRVEDIVSSLEMESPSFKSGDSAIILSGALLSPSTCATKSQWDNKEPLGRQRANPTGTRLDDTVQPRLSSSVKSSKES